MIPSWGLGFWYNVLPGFIVTGAMLFAMGGVTHLTNPWVHRFKPPRTLKDPWTCTMERREDYIRELRENRRVQGDFQGLKPANLEEL